MIFQMGFGGKYAARYRESSNIVKLDDDVAEIFPNTHEVNDALRTLGKLIRNHANIGLTKKSS